MIKIYKILFILSSSFFALGFSSPKKEIKSIYSLKSYAGQIKSKDLMKDLRGLVLSGSPNRFFGTIGHKSSQEYLRLRLTELSKSGVSTENKFKISTNIGVDHFEQDFKNKIIPNFKAESLEYKKWNSFKNYMKNLILSKSEVEGINFVWTKKGESNKFLTVTAHYDTVSHNKKTLKIDESEKMPGADFNASSVAVALNLIKLLEPLKLKHGVRVVFLDAQSIGFLGSFELAKNLSQQKDTIGVINLEMLGNDSRKFDKEKKLRNFKVYMRSNKTDSLKSDISFYNDLLIYPKKASVNMDFKRDANDFKSSDNFRFTDVGIPAITYSQNWETDFNQRFQTQNDFPETINRTTLHNAFKYLSIAVLGYALQI